MKNKLTTFHITNIIKGKAREMNVEISNEQIDRLASKLEDATFEFINSEAKEIIWAEGFEIEKERIKKE